MKGLLSKTFKSLGETPNYQGMKNEPGKAELKTVETEGSQGHPAKPAQPGSMRFLDKD